MSLLNHETNFYAFDPDDTRNLFFEDGILDIEENTEDKLGTVKTPYRWISLDPEMFWYDNCFPNLWRNINCISSIRNTYIRNNVFSLNWLNNGDNAYRCDSASAMTGEPYVSINVINACNMFANLHGLENNYSIGLSVRDASNMYRFVNNIPGFVDIPPSVTNLNGAFYTNETYPETMLAYGGVWNVRSIGVYDVGDMFGATNNARPSYWRKALHLKVSQSSITNNSFAMQKPIGMTLNQVPEDGVMSYDNIYIHYDPTWEYETYDVDEVLLYRDPSNATQNSLWNTYANNSKFGGIMTIEEMDDYRYSQKGRALELKAELNNGDEYNSYFGVDMTYMNRLKSLYGYDDSMLVLGFPSTVHSSLNFKKPNNVTFAGDMTDAWSLCTNLPQMPKFINYFECYRKVEVGVRMFSECTNMSMIVPKNFNYLTNASYMFYNCGKMMCDASAWDMNNVVDASYMCYNCHNLGLLPHINNATNAYRVFENCYNGMYSMQGDLSFNQCLNITGAFSNSKVSGEFVVIPDCSPNFSNSFRNTNISQVTFNANVEDLNCTFADSNVTKVIFTNDIVSGRGHNQQEFKDHIQGMFAGYIDSGKPLDITLPNVSTSGSSLLRQVLMGDWQQEDERYRHDSKCFGSFNATSGGYDNRIILWTDDMMAHTLSNAEYGLVMHYGL